MQASNVMDMKKALSFDELMQQPSQMKSGTDHLPDGRPFIIHELPCSALDEISRIGQQAIDENRDISIRDISNLAARAMLGRDPSREEVTALMNRFSEPAIVHIYKSAIKFSKLGEEGLAESKKD